MRWFEKIPNTFGAADKLFARHQSELEVAADILNDAVKQQVPFPTLYSEFKNWLSGEVSNADHVAAELSRVADFYQTWLDHP